MLHAWHVPHDGEPQQTPSIQLPLTQAKPLPQLLPFVFSWQVPPMQVLPPPALGAMELQSLAVLVHEPLQVPLAASHWKVSHDTEVPGVHPPLPSQAPAVIAANDCEAVPPLKAPDTGGAQEAEPQVVPAFVSWHPPLPSQLPVSPQGLLTGQVVVSRGVPLAAILVQVPFAPEIVQLWQAPVQAELQHTPSELQKPLLQSVLALQACPLGSVVPHVLVILRQVCLSQSVSDVHVVLHDGLVVSHT